MNNKPIKAEISLIYFPTKLAPIPFGSRIPLGLLYLGSIANENGFTVNLFDFQNPLLSIDDIKSSIPMDTNHIVGFYCDSDNISRVIGVSERLLNCFPNIYILLGGPHVTSSPKEEYLSERRFIVRSEGEYPFSLLAKFLLRGEGSMEEIPSITYKNHKSTLSNPISFGQYQDVNKCPNPDYNLLNPSMEYIPVVLTSRGCIYNCHFCSEGKMQNGYRPRSISNVREELLNLRKRYEDINHLFICFADDTFTVSPKRVEKMCDVIDEIFPDKSRFTFYCEGRVNILDENLYLVERLKASGLARLQIGIESGNQQTLDRINKKIRLNQIERVIEKAHKVDISTIFGAFLIGIPGQTEDEVLSDIEFAKHLIDLAPGRIEIEAGILTPLPGTEFGKNLDKWGFYLQDADFLTGNVTESPFGFTSELSKDDIVRLKKLFKAEINRYSLNIISKIEKERLKKYVTLASNFHLIAPPIKQLSMYSFGRDIVNRKVRKICKFISEIPSSEIDYLLPYACSNSINHFDQKIVINKKSPLGFILNKDEFSYYEYFKGKASFAKIAEIMSQKKGIGLEVARKTALNVYKKCEDHLAGLCIY